MEDMPMEDEGMNVVELGLYLQQLAERIEEAYHDLTNVSSDIWEALAESKDSKLMDRLGKALDELALLLGW
jgi:hypothetical protein